MEDIICRAKIETKFSKVLFTIIPIVSIIAMLLFHFIYSFNYYNHAKQSSYYKGESFFNYFFGDFFDYIFLVYEWYGVLIYVTAFLLVWKFVVKSMVGYCSLNLDKDGVNGRVKNIFGRKTVQLPIEKVDSISVENRIIDKLYGGETVAIRSTSGLIRFMCVQNASEFVNETLNAIKAYKESNKTVSENVPVNANGDSLEQISKLKEMLDNGIITQEEFNAKKKQLLGL